MARRGYLGNRDEKVEKYTDRRRRGEPGREKETISRRGLKSRTC